MRIICLITFTMLLMPGLMYADTQTIPVSRISSSPVIDGDLAEWGNDGWNTIPVKPAVEDDKDNYTGAIDIELQTTIVDDNLYMAVRWPDRKQDIDYKRWVWKRKKYKRRQEMDDRFAVRFFMDGDFDACMMAEKSYKSDVWLWSSGRSNLAGYANDMWQIITTDMIEDAAEYKGPTGQIIYIKKYYDAGNPVYENNKPNRKKFAGDKLPGIRVTANPSGSVTDVRAKGVWKDGFWNLEMMRRLNTNNPDDVTFQSDKPLLGAIAVYNRGEAEHKSVSGELLFEFKK